MADIAERIEAIYKEASGVWASFGVTSWERDRLDEWRGRAHLTPGQLHILAQIERKVFAERANG